MQVMQVIMNLLIVIWYIMYNSMKCQSFVVVDFVVEEVKRKWGNVRSQYGDELRKMRQFKSGMGTDEIYSSK